MMIRFLRALFGLHRASGLTWAEVEATARTEARLAERLRRVEEQARDEARRRGIEAEADILRRRAEEGGR